MTNQDKLKPCPFCGGKVELVKDHTTEETDWIKHTGNNCGVAFDNFNDDCPVDILWNIRTDAAEIKRLREALEKVLADARDELNGWCEEYGQYDPSTDHLDFSGKAEERFDDLSERVEELEITILPALKGDQP